MATSNTTASIANARFNVEMPARRVSAALRRAQADPSRHDAQRDGVANIQRTRMLAAMVRACAELGVTNVTVAHVVERATVSRRTFYEVFEDRDDCFLAALEQGFELLADRVGAAHGRAERWRDRMRLSLIALLELFDEEPLLARLLVVDALAAGREALERRDRVLLRAVAAIEDGQAESRAAPVPTHLTAEGVAGAVLAVLHGRISRREPGRLVDLVNPLMAMIVLPYLGPAGARREAERPRPPVVQRSAEGAHNPLQQLEMRLTYRTVRVLMAVAASPGRSNRSVAVEAGVEGQGQISKLLARLEKLGLVGNANQGRGRGAPNAWSLTERGEEVRAVLAPRI